MGGGVSSRQAACQTGFAGERSGLKESVGRNLGSGRGGRGVPRGKASGSRRTESRPLDGGRGGREACGGGFWVGGLGDPGRRQGAEAVGRSDCVSGTWGHTRASVTAWSPGGSVGESGVAVSCASVGCSDLRAASVPAPVGGCQLEWEEQKAEEVGVTVETPEGSGASDPRLRGRRRWCR